MASETLTLEAFGELMKAKANQLGKRLDATRPLKVIATLIKADTLENFQGSHDPDRNPWAPLKNPRPKRKGQQAGTDKPLMDRGILRTASTSGATIEITPSGLTYSVSAANVLDYADTHQRGRTIRQPARKRVKPWVFPAGAGGGFVFTRKIKAHDVKIPQRQFLGFGTPLLGKIDDVLGDWLEGQAA